MRRRRRLCLAHFQQEVFPSIKPQVQIMLCRSFFFRNSIRISLSTKNSDTNFHSFIWQKEDGQTSWAHSCEFWSPSGGLSQALVMISSRPLILPVKEFLKAIYSYVFKEGITLESLSSILHFFFSLMNSTR